MSPYRASAAVFVLLAAACGSPWRVIRSGPPAALADVSAWTVRFDDAALEVDGEPLARWLERAEPADRDELTMLRGEIETRYVEALGEALAPATVSTDEIEGAGVIEVAYGALEAGRFGPIYSTSSRLDVRVRFSVGGSVTDEIELRSARRADVYNPDRGQRLRACASHLAEVTAEYVRRAR